MGTGGVVRLLFRESSSAGASDGSGPYIDDVVLAKVPETPAPTAAPTPSPTKAPTPSPTMAPTPAPTPSPTMAPTPAPTPWPTPSPTLAATPAPTPYPTPWPTIPPTMGPTLAGTPLPTYGPTFGPSLEVTSVPVNFCDIPSDNLVCNGSFEANEVIPGTAVAFTVNLIPGWFSKTNGGKLTLINDCFGKFAQDGANFAQLDALSSTNQEGIFQMIPTIQGEQYRLTFWMRALNEANADSDDEAVIVSDESSMLVTLFLS